MAGVIDRESTVEGGAGQPDHLIDLGSGRWRLWRECVLRGAGFPAVGVLDLADPDLATAVDTADPARPTDPPDEALRERYAEAAAELTARARRLAADPRFREAVTWQNPDVVRFCLDRLLAEDPQRPTKPSDRRQRELAITAYAQRYAMKNDTIGFFGPVAWSSWVEDGPALDVRPGPGAVRRRTVYFEHWAIDALADALAEQPAMRPWLTPRRSASDVLENGAIRTARGESVALSPAQLGLLRRCDGRRTVRELVDAAPGLGPELDALVDTGRVLLDLRVAVQTRPEDALRERLGLVGDDAARTSALAALDELVAARDAVSAAAGDPDALGIAIVALDEVFERVTGRAAARRAGQTYGARRVVYEDTVRDVDVRLGPELRDALAEPLTLLLDSARWYVGRAGVLYRERFRALWDQARDRTGTGRDEVPLAALVGAATPDLMFSPRELRPLVAELAADLRSRWGRVLRVPPGVRRHHVEVADVRDAAEAEFAWDGPVPWSSAVHHAPDVMIAAAGPDAVNRGEYTFVLGELHVAANTLASRLFVEQHDDPERLLAADTADHAGRRVFPVSARSSDLVNARTVPPALLSPTHTYWSMYADTTGAPGPEFAVADLDVVRGGDGLVVRSRRTRQTFDVLDVLGEYLSLAVLNGFGLLPPAAHRPRVSLGRLVVSREAWTFRAEELAWASVRDEVRRYRAARYWRREHDLPERLFYRVPVEDKPAYLDLTSIAFVHTFAKAVRRTLDQHGPDASVTVTELLPGPDECWLVDATGARHTSELRLLAVDPTA